MRYVTVAAAAALTVGVLAAPSLSSDRGQETEWIQATCEIEEGEPSESEGALHVRGETHHDVIYMDLGDGAGFQPVGSNTIVMDYDVSLKTGNGQSGGTFAADLPALGASFSGHFNGQIRAGMLTARAVGEGSGAMAGAKMKARIVQFVPSEAQLEWMCEGGEVAKAVTVFAHIRTANRADYQRTECVIATGPPAPSDPIEGVFVVRDLPYLGVLFDESGAQVGTNEGVVSLEQNADGSGWIRGTLEIRDAVMGEFDGSFAAIYENFEWAGRGEADGVGDHEGKRLTMDVRSFHPDVATCGPAPSAQGWIDGAQWDVSVKVK